MNYAMTKRLTKSQRTERKCMFCDALFTPKKGATKGYYCGNECRSRAVGYMVGRSNLSINYEMSSPEEHRIYYDESIDKDIFDV